MWPLVIPAVISHLRRKSEGKSGMGRLWKMEWKRKCEQQKSTNLNPHAICTHFPAFLSRAASKLLLFVELTKTMFQWLRSLTDLLNPSLPPHTQHTHTHSIAQFTPLKWLCTGGYLISQMELKRNRGFLFKRKKIQTTKASIQTFREPKHVHVCWGRDKSE